MCQFQKVIAHFSDVDCMPCYTASLRPRPNSRRDSNTAVARAASTEADTQRPQRFTLTLIDAFIKLYIDISRFKERSYELLGTRGSKAHDDSGSRRVRPLRSGRMSGACDSLRRRAGPSKWPRGPFKADS